MSNLFVLLLLIFAGVALMVVLGARFAKPVDPEHTSRLQRWFLPLMGLVLVLSALEYFLR